MIGEKFFTSISSLTSSELNSCIRMSKISYFNKREEVTETIELFKKNKNRFFSLLQEEEKLFSTLFKKEKQFKRRLLLDHFHYCTTFVEDCIIQQSIQNDKEKRLEILQEFYIKHDKTKEALAINNQLYKIIEKKKLNINNYFEKYQFYVSKFNILVTEFDNETFENVELAMEELDKFYFLAKLNLNQELESNKLHVKNEYDVILIDEIKNEIQKNPKLSHDFYFQIYDLTSDLYSGIWSQEKYFKLKSLVINHIDSFDSKNKRALLIDLSNYCSIMYSKNGDVKLLREFFNIFKLKNDYNVLLSGGIITRNDLNQLISVALYLKEFDWAIKFLDDYEEYIVNKTSLLLFRAQIAYSMESYDEVLEMLNSVSITGFAENTMSKMIYAKTLYDTKQFDLLEPHLNAYEIYLRRQREIEEELNENHLRFVLYFKRLYKNIYNADRIEKLKNDLAKDLSVLNRNWLISRIEKLS